MQAPPPGPQATGGHIHCTGTACPACNAVQQAGNLEKAVDALERSATSQEKQGSPFHAAKHFETCAELSHKQGKLEDCSKFVKMAADMYVDCGKSVTGEWRAGGALHAPRACHAMAAWLHRR